jgi:hypothetical protein
MLTGCDERYADELRSRPFARVLRKPLDPWQLCEAIAAVLHTGHRGHCGPTTELMDAPRARTVLYIEDSPAANA